MAKIQSILDAEIGANMRRLRMAAGLTLEALSYRLGITFQQVQKYESGANRISASRLALICAVLLCPVTEIITDEVVSDALDDRQTDLGEAIEERQAA